MLRQLQAPLNRPFHEGNDEEDDQVHHWDHEEQRHPTWVTSLCYRPRTGQREESEGDKCEDYESSGLGLDVVLLYPSARCGNSGGFWQDLNPIW